MRPVEANVKIMNEFIDTQHSFEDLQNMIVSRRKSGGSRSSNLPPAYHDSLHQFDHSAENYEISAGVHGDSLDEIISQNNMELQTRQTLPRQYDEQEGDHRSSLMELDNSNTEFNVFQYSGQHSSENHEPRKRSTFDMSNYEDVELTMNLSGTKMNLSNREQAQNDAANTETQFQNISEHIYGNMMLTSMGMKRIPDEFNQCSEIYSPNFSRNCDGDNVDYSVYNLTMAPSTLQVLPPHHDGSIITSRMPRTTVDGKDIVTSSKKFNTSQFTSPFVSTSAKIPVPDSDQSFPQIMRFHPVETHETSFSTESYFKSNNLYCQSGFDMLGALVKVASRKNPEINIGKVDMSCAFAVCDVLQYDCPIIYVSDVFERLTGYSKYEVKGRNCRFLQSPEGKVEAGTTREFVDNESVYYLKQRIEQRKEAQRSVINYRKGGQPFMNLLTIIPITGEDNETIKYLVGFQVDLVERPSSVQGKTPCGNYTVDYSQSIMPIYVWQPPKFGLHKVSESGQTISKEDVSMVLTSINSGIESELAKRMWDKMILENTDDVVHVLSLKGLFLYLSPSSRNVLEYDASELVGTALSSVCHPSDIVSVTRELKDTSTGSTVNVLYRIRRKKSGYTWFESHGSLCVEQGKGRKCIILVGRERPVYALHRHDIEAAGGIGENEMWNKISTSGMFLFVSSNVRSLLDRSPEDLVGTSIQALMRTESKLEFCRSLEKASTGRRITYKHEILSKRGLMMQAQTTLYPGDALEGQKPTFLVAQTKLVKASLRGVNGANSQLSTSSALQGQPGDTESSVSDSRGLVTKAGNHGLAIGSQHVALASDSNIFDELKTTRCTSWQFELRQMEKSNRMLAEELAALISSKKKRKRRKGAGYLQRDCANCHTRVTPEWRRGPSGHRDLCNSCGLRYAKQNGRVSPRVSHSKTSRNSASPVPSSLQQELFRSSPKTTSQNTSSNISHNNSIPSSNSKSTNPTNSSRKLDINVEIEAASGFKEETKTCTNITAKKNPIDTQSSIDISRNFLCGRDRNIGRIIDEDV